MLEKSDMNEFKMNLFDNGDPEQFLLFVQNYKMTLEASGKLTENAKFQYLRTILCGKALRKFESLCAHIVRMTMTRLNQVLLGLET